MTRNIHREAENGALPEFVEQLQSRVGERRERRDRRSSTLEIL